MEQQIRVRVNPTCVLRYLGEEYRAGDVLSMPVDKAIYFSDTGSVTMLDYVKRLVEYEKPSVNIEITKSSSKGEGEKTEEEEF